ncbi:diguanylate cyclase domain-containing protein [Pseudothermotoga sp. U03pept]|uniref:GAF domain-containing protein n=1 Tax=Pseudothermotoga sp. U03pept TaxID=3447012 RepID=UPI003EFF06BE
MKKAGVIFLLAAVIFVVCIFIFYNLNLRNFKERIQTAEAVIDGAANFIALALSENLFTSDQMYEAALNDAQSYIQSKLQEIKTKYLHVLSASIKQASAQTVEKIKDFQINFTSKNLEVVLKIYDENRLRHLTEKLAFVVIDLEGLLSSLGFTDIVLCEESKLTIHGIGCKPTTALLSSGDYLFSFLVSVTSVVFIRWLSVRKMVQLERKYKDELLKRTQLHEALLKFTELILSGNTEQASQFILEKAVEFVPGAQAGSLLMKEQDHFVFTNVCGYDRKFVDRMFFKVEELAQGMNKEIKIIRNLHQLNEQSLDQERKKLLYSDERVGQIKVLLSVPVVVQNETIAFFNLDNFETEDAFDERSIEIALLLAGQVGLLFERIKLEEELKKQKEMLEYLSYHDSLTDLPNRRLLEECAEKLFALARREEKSISLVFVDLHKFKEVNDTFGHPVGDQILKIVATRAQRVVRKNDILARLGGDEFVFLLYNSTSEESAAFARRLLFIIHEPIVVQNITFSISANMGIAFYPTDGDNLETLLRNADMALYVAKRKKVPFAFYKESI